MNYLLKVIFGILFISTSAFAGVEDTNWAAKKSSIYGRSAGVVSKSIARRNQRASEYMSKDDYKRAIEIFKGITTASKQNFEVAQAYNNLGLAYARTDKYKLAITAFEKALLLNALPLKPTLQSIYSLAQIQTMNKGDSKALKLMKGWFVLAKRKKAGALVFTGSLYKKIGNSKLALQMVEEAIAMTKKPKEQWLIFAVALHYESKNYDKAGLYLKQLIGKNLKKRTYWVQLAATLLSKEKFKDALAVMEMAYRLGHLNNETEIVNIVSLFVQTGMPFQGARFLERAIKDEKVKGSKKSYELLSNAFVASREYRKALTPLSKAAKLSKDGKLYAHQGRLYLNEENWIKALESFNLAEKKGGVKKKGNLYIDKGIALMQLKKLEQAKLTLQKALDFEGSKKNALLWLDYISSL
jgi:tetratricopeptide (TPR) repeat protein